MKYDFNPFELTGETPKGVRDKQALFEEIADFVIREVQERTSSSETPVRNGKWRSQLTKAYAEKTGKNKADLFEEGDLMNSLIAGQLKGHTMRFTVAEDQQGKADGHNNFTGKANKKYLRQFVPNVEKRQKFDDNIINGIRSIIKDHKE